MNNLRFFALQLLLSLCVVTGYHFIFVGNGTASPTLDTPQSGGTAASSVAMKSDISRHPEFIRLRQQISRLEAKMRIREGRRAPVRDDMRGRVPARDERLREVSGEPALQSMAGKAPADRTSAQLN